MTARVDKLHKVAKQTESTHLGMRDIDKEYTRAECEVEGTIPLWVNGNFYAQSGGAFGRSSGEKEKKFSGTNILDGLAHVIAFHIEGGQAQFSNKFMRTIPYETFVKTGKREWKGADTSPGKKRNSDEVLYSGSNPNVTFWVFDGGKSIAATTEGEGEVCVFDNNNLTTLRSFKSIQLDSTEGIRTIISTASHFFREGNLGGYHVALELEINKEGITKFAYDIFHGDAENQKSFNLVYQHVVATLPLKKIGEINLNPSLRPSYMHTIAQSENYLVLILSSNKWDYVKLLSMDFTDGFFNMFPKLEHPIQFLVFKRNSNSSLNKPVLFSSNVVGMAFHIGNCYERGANLILETTLTKNYKSPYASFYAQFQLNLKHPEETVYCKYLYENFEKLPTEVNAGSFLQFEFPNINPAYHQRPHKYVFGLVNTYEATSNVVRLDVEEKTFKACKLLAEDRFILPEPVIVPHPYCLYELNAIVLVLALDIKSSKSKLFILDGETLEICSIITCPMACNLGIHSVFVGKTRSSLNNLISKY
eukprot:snap_masked-scaffold_7-processed-gene-10.31-mRNA-1 protein AED:1.00 eAED:1.00 QI:0/-1/0/0/-1/1/1/0/532